LNPRRPPSLPLFAWIFPVYLRFFILKETSAPWLGHLENSEPEFSKNMGIVQKQLAMQSKSPFLTDLGQQ
jgi:hypothetical protein